MALKNNIVHAVKDPPIITTKDSGDWIWSFYV